MGHGSSNGSNNVEVAASTLGAMAGTIDPEHVNSSVSVDGFVSTIIACRSSLRPSCPCADRGWVRGADCTELTCDMKVDGALSGARMPAAATC